MRAARCRQPGENVPDTDELAERVIAAESAVSKLNADLTSVKEVTAEMTRWMLMGLGALGITGMTAAALGVTPPGLLDRYLRGG